MKWRTVGTLANVLIKVTLWLFCERIGTYLEDTRAYRRSIQVSIVLVDSVLL